MKRAPSKKFALPRVPRPALSLPPPFCPKVSAVLRVCAMLFIAAPLFALGLPLSEGPPALPPTFTTTVTSVMSGTSPSAPKGTQVYKQFFDFTNKRLRKDTNGISKVYRYDKPIQPPIDPGPNDPHFATPKGYQFQTDKPDSTCCWLWLWAPRACCWLITGSYSN